MNVCPLCKANVISIAAHYLVCPVAVAELEDDKEKKLLGEISTRLDSLVDKKAGR